MFKGWVLLFSIAICYSCELSAQSLRGKVIYVSSRPVKLMFGSRIASYSLVERDQTRLFNIQAGKKNLAISSVLGDFRSANLVVTEGSNTHLFILRYEEPGNVEQLYDFSSADKLNAEIQQLNEGENAIVKAAPVVQAPSIPQPLPDNTTARPAEDSIAKPAQETVTIQAVLTDSVVEVKATNPVRQDSTISKPPAEVVSVKEATIIPAISKPKDSITITPRTEKNLPAEAIASNEGASRTSIPAPQNNVPAPPVARNESVGAPIKQAPEISTIKKPETTSKPKRNDEIIIMSGPSAKQRTDSIIFMSGVDKNRVGKNSGVRMAERTDSIIFISGVAKGKLTVETKSASKLEKADTYEQLIHLGDSTAWIVRDFKGSLRWYDSAQKINPYSNYPRKQIAAVKAAISEQLEDAKKARSEKFKLALADYKLADALRIERKYDEAYKGYKKFLSQVDSTNLTEYKSSELYYINQAKDYVTRLQPYLPKPRPQVIPAPAAEKTSAKKKKGTP